MAEKILNTLIKLRYDSHENWLSNDPVLKAGEVAISTVAVKQEGTVNFVPSCLMKVGDDTHKYSELGFTYAKAADVLAACKSEDALKAFVNGVIADAGIATDEALNALTTRVSSTESAITTLNGTGAGSVAKSISDAIAALNLANTYDAKGAAADVQSDLDAYKTTNNTAVGNKVDKVAGKSLISDSEITRLAAMSDGANKVEASTVNGNIKIDGTETKVYTHPDKHAISDVTGLQAALDDAKKAGTDAASAAATEKTRAEAAEAGLGTRIDGVEESIGTVATGKTVVEMIADAQTAATYDDSALVGRVSTVEGKVTTLVGTDASKSARAIAAEEVAKIVAGADASYDTLKEIADWISSHGSDASAMNTAILALQSIVDGIGGTGEKATVVEYVTDAIAALKIGDYAKAADLTALGARVQTLEGVSHSHANKTVLDGINATKITAWDAAEKNAKAYADSLASNYDAAGAAAAVKQELDTYKTSNEAAVAKKANDADLAAIAKSGNVNDLIQTAGDVLVFDCGDSTN